MRQVAERLAHPPVRVERGDRLAVDVGHRVEDGDRPVLRDDVERGTDPLADQLAVRLDVRLYVGERAAVAGQAQPRVELLDDVERRQEFSGRVGRVAVVVVERHAPEQVVAGDEQPAIGLVERDVRRRVARRLVHRPAPEVGVDLHSGQEVAVGLDDPGHAEALVAARLGEALQRLGRHAAGPRHLHAPAQPLVGVLGRPREVVVVGMHPQLAAGAVDDRRRLPVVVGVGVRTHDQPDVLEAQIDHRQRALEVGQRALVVVAGVEQDDPVACGDRPRVAVRHAWPRQGQAQPPDPRQHALAATDLALFDRLRHGGGP